MTSRLHFDNSYQRLAEPLYSRVTPQPFERPKLIIASVNCMALLDLEAPTDKTLLSLCGTPLFSGMQPVAQKYSGHQFGVYNPDLGDGRGLLLGEVINRAGERWDLHLKGAGKTPYSRMGDGRAVLRSSIREFLASEALHHLGIPTTRALCIIGSNEPVYRETEETGAMLCRVARSHIRFGHFEYLHHTEQHDLLKTFTDYVINLHFPAFQQEKNAAELMFQEVIKRTAIMIAHWQAAGFCHGVMNSDNFSILGDTFDFGPYGFLDRFTPSHICNHSDWQGRYAFNRQPEIGLWNLNCLALALSSLIPREALVSALQQYEQVFHSTYLALMKNKLGLNSDEESDGKLIGQLLDIMAKQGSDYTRTFRALSNADVDHRQARAEFSDTEAFDQWHQSYQARLQRDPHSEQQRVTLMQQSNPKYILRNYLAQQAISHAQQGDYQELHRLFTLLQDPYSEQPEQEHYAALPPDWGQHLEISCSS